MKITLDLTKQECRIIRDALSKRWDIEDKYQREIASIHGREKVKNLLELSEREQKKVGDLLNDFSRIYLLTDWIKDA